MPACSPRPSPQGQQYPRHTPIPTTLPRTLLLSRHLPAISQTLTDQARLWGLGVTPGTPAFAKGVLCNTHTASREPTEMPYPGTVVSTDGDPLELGHGIGCGRRHRSRTAHDGEACQSFSLVIMQPAFPLLCQLQSLQNASGTCIGHCHLYLQGGTEDSVTAEWLIY